MHQILRASWPVLLVLVLATASTGDQQKPDQLGNPVVLEISGPVVVGFFPPVSQSQIESEEGTSEGIAHLQWRLSDIVSVDRTRLSDSNEAWVHVLINGEEGNVHGLKIFSGLGPYPRAGILTWANTD